MRRRRFLALAAASIGAPSLWIPRISRAATPAFGAAKHLLILFARGGLRSHATFNAVGTTQHNPFGVQPAAPGTEWALGAACGHADLETSRGSIEAFAKITDQVAVIPCVDHAPGERPVIDHYEGTLRIGTGANADAAGLLSLIGKHHPDLVGGWPSDRAPPVEIGLSPFGHGPGEYRAVRPLAIVDARRPLISSSTLGQGRGIEARRVLDAELDARTPAAYRARIEGFLGSKENAYRFARLLASPLLAVASQLEATGGGFSNRELLEIFGADDRSDGPRWGVETALAVRLLALGSPAVVITKAGFDFHDHERELYGPATSDLVRQLAGLYRVLGRMEHSAGGTFWDHTVIAVVSEFSRNSGSPSGFNSGSGSDHVEDDPAPMRNQAIPLMGGPIAAKGKLIGATDSEMQPLGSVHSSRSLLATFLDLLGIEPASFWPDPPIRELFS